MNGQSDTSQWYPADAAPAPMSVTRPMYWSVRRELWENRSIYLAPLIVTAVVLFASLISMIGLPKRMRSLPTLDPVQQHIVVVKPFSIAPAPIMFVTFLVGLFYCLDALYGERRDRSILFWKSLPVSDRTTVLSKAGIPLVVLPLIACVLSIVTVAIMMFASTFVLLANGMSPARLWAEHRFVQEPLVMVYGMAVHSLWLAPIYGWLLLVSAWARRAPFLWALLPLFAIVVLERIAFGTSHFCSLMQYRFNGAMQAAFVLGGAKAMDIPIIDRLSQLTPAKFLGTPGLWVGLVMAALFLAAAIRLRRNREPI